jgi:transposase
MPRVKCESCGKIRTVVIDWARPGAGFSLYFEAHVMSLMLEMPVAAVARKVGEHDTRLWRVFKHYVNEVHSLTTYNLSKTILAGKQGMED